MKFGHYEVSSELGRGGMGVVYKAWDPTLDRFVAIKVLAENLSHDLSLKQRFIREAKAMATINHPNVIHIHFIGEESGQPYFSMEFIEGESLGCILKHGNVLSLLDAKNIVYQACEGLLSAHAKGLIHRDIKPDNLMITNNGLVKIVDFGIVRSHDAGDKLTNTGELVGTPGYLSPEVCIGKEIDIRSDIFSLGVVFYEMLAGKAPFENDSPLGLMLEVVQSEIIDIRKINKKIDRKTANIINKMVEKSPEDRYQTCSQVLIDLGKPQTNQSIESIKSKAQIINVKSIIKATSSEQTIVNDLGQSKQTKSPHLTSIKKKIIYASFAFIVILIPVLFYLKDSNFKDSKNQNQQALQAPANTEDSSLNIGMNNKKDTTKVSNQKVNQPSNKRAKTTSSKKKASQSVKLNVAYKCIEVYKFTVDKNNTTSKELQRAAKTPKEILNKIQNLTVKEIVNGDYGLKALETNKCPNNNDSLVLKGTVVDYKKGSKTTRYLIGLGAGQQKFQVDLVLSKKKSNEVIAKQLVTDRKVGGFLGGSDKKGQSDFVEKIDKFVRESIGLKDSFFDKIKKKL